MPDLVTTANQLKGVPDQWLQHELAAPSGAVPSYLVLAEAQRRATLRSGGAQSKQQQASSVYDDVLRNLTSGAPPAGPPAPPGMASPPSGLGQLTQGGPPPPQNFKPPQALAEGGSVDDSGDDTEEDYIPPSTGSASRGADGDQYDHFVQDSAQRNGVDPDLVRAVIKNESNFKRGAVSKKGATGLMQLMPGAARDMGVKDRKDPQQNIEGGTRYLKWLSEQPQIHGDPDLILAGYNAGPGAVQQHGGVPPYKQTKNYINLVKGTLYQLKNNQPAADTMQQSTADTETAPQPPEEPGGTPPELTPASDPSALTMAALNNWGAQPEGPAPPSAAPATPTAPADEASVDPYSDKNIERQRKLFERLYGSKAEPGADLKAEIRRIRAESARLAKPSGWQMLADFGWGMATSPAHSLFTQIGAGGQAMSKGMADRMEEARKQQLALLGIDVKLDDQARDAQGKIAQLTGQAVNQAANKQISDFEVLARTPGNRRGDANQPPGANWRFEPNPTGGKGVWVSPTTSTASAEMLPSIKAMGLKNASGQDYRVGDEIPLDQATKIRDKMLEVYTKGQEKGAAPSTRDAQLFTGSAQTIGGRYGIPKVSSYLDLPETLTLQSPVTLPDNVRRPDGTIIPAGTVLPAGATVYPRQEAETLYNRSAVEKSGAMAVTKMFDNIEGRTQLADQMTMDPASKETFIKTGKFPSSPAMMDSMAEMVANYDIPWTQTISRMPPADREIFSDVVKKKNPQFVASNFDVAKKTETGFLGGKQADKMQSINAALGHMGVMNDAIDAMRNGDIKKLNQIANSMGAAIGATPAQTFKTIVHTVGPELAKAYIPGAGTGEDRAKVESDFSENLPPDQLHNNTAIRAKLLAGVMDSMIHEYQVGTYGRGKGHAKFFTPQSIATLEKLTPGTFKPPTAEVAPAAGGAADVARTPTRPATIPWDADAQYSSSRKQWRYKPKGSTEWQTLPATQ